MFSSRSVTKKHNHSICNMRRFAVTWIYSKWQSLVAKFGLSASANSLTHHKEIHVGPVCKPLDKHGSITFENQPSSWLFVSGSVGGAYGAQVNLDLGLDKKLTCQETLDELKSNMKSRGYHNDCGLDELVTGFATLLCLKKQKDDLIMERTRLATEIAVQKEREKLSQEELSSIQNLVLALKDVKNKISSLQPFWDLQERVFLAALKLPNELHPTTPLNEIVIAEEVLDDRDIHNTQSHVEIAKMYDLIKFSNVGPKAFYLKGELMQAEMCITNAVIEYLQSKQYWHISGPEFFKTPVMEGVGLDVTDSQKVLTMLDTIDDVIEPMNHLAGISPATFAAFVARTCIGDNFLPLNMFACGRTYQKSDLPGLFGAVQSTQAGIFSCVKEEDVENQFQETVDLIWSFLKPLEFSIRSVLVCAKDLQHQEKRRTDFEMFIPSLGYFIKIASIADLGDFVSRRLMVIHNQNHADIRSAKQLHMISGIFVNITSLLAIWMEHRCKNEEIFTDIADEIFSFLKLKR